MRRELGVEAERLRSRLSELTATGTRTLPLDTLAVTASRLLDSLADLEGVVGRQLALGVRIEASRVELFALNAGAGRLLGPWQEVLREQTTRRLERLPERLMDAGWQDRIEQANALAILIDHRDSTEHAQRLFAAAVDLLLEASGTVQPSRLPILGFQSDLMLRRLARSASGLDAELQPLLLSRMEALRRFIDGPDSVIDARRQELSLNDEAVRRLATTEALSARLITEVDRLGGLVQAQVGDAIADALRVQCIGAQALLVLVAFGLCGSVLIVQLYVGRNVGRRLTVLGDRMIAITRGDLHPSVDVTGSDEIAVLARAVDLFRRNALERDRLLEQQARATELLERKVELRTAELKVVRQHVHLTVPGGGQPRSAAAAARVEPVRRAAARRWRAGAA